MERRTKLVWSLLLGIIILATIMRLYDLGHYPPGVSTAEAAIGVTAVRILQGALPALFVEQGAFALFWPLLVAGSMASLGVGVWQLHFMPAVIGIATVIAMYFATRPWFGRLSGLLAALLLATSSWHVTVSRTAQPEILLPLLFAVFTAGLGYSIIFSQKKKLTASYVTAAIAGIAASAYLYCTLNALVVLVVLLGVAIILLLGALHPKVELTHFDKYWRQLIIGVSTCIILSAPLIWSITAEPGAVTASFAVISSAPAWWQNIRTLVLSLFVSNSFGWLAGVAAWPLLNPLTGLLTILGVAWTIGWCGVTARKIIRGLDLHLGLIFPYLLLTLLSWLAVAALNPDALIRERLALGLLGPVYLLAGTAGAVCLWWWQRRKKSEMWAAISLGSIIGVISLFGIFDGSLYFIFARVDAEAATTYRSDLVALTQHLNDIPQVEEVAAPYLVMEPDDIPIVEFLLSATGRPVRQLNPATSHLIILEPGAVIIFSRSTLPQADRFERERQGVVLIKASRDRWHREEFRVYQVPAGPGSTPPDVTSDLDA